MLSNAYFLAKFRFDTAENEPAKNLQNFTKFANFADPPNSAEVQHQLAAIGREKLLELSDCLDAFVAPEFLGGTSRVTKVAVEGHRGPTIGKIPANCCSFSAVSAPIFARKYAFCSIFQNLPDSQAEIFEI